MVQPAPSQLNPIATASWPWPRDPEPLPAGHAFYCHPRIRLSPHTSMMPPGAGRRLAAKLADNIARYRRGEPVLDLVDPACGY